MNFCRAEGPYFLFKNYGQCPLHLVGTWAILVVKCLGWDTTPDDKHTIKTRWRARGHLVTNQRKVGFEKESKSFLKPGAAIFQCGGTKLAPSFSLGNNKWELWKINTKHTLALCTTQYHMKSRIIMYSNIIAGKNSVWPKVQYSNTLVPGEIAFHGGIPFLLSCPASKGN